MTDPLTEGQRSVEDIARDLLQPTYFHLPSTEAWIDRLRAVTAALRSEREARSRSESRERELTADLAFWKADHERLANLLKTTRDANLVDMTADRDSWEEQNGITSDVCDRLFKRIAELEKALREIVTTHERGEYWPDEMPGILAAIARRVLATSEKA